MKTENDAQTQETVTAEGDMNAQPENTSEESHPTTAKKRFGRLDEFFGITRSGSNFKSEIIAGLTTFMAMVYAVLVVPGMYGVKVGDVVTYPNVSFNAVYIATVLGAIIGTALMAFLARMPLAQASGLGATAYITGTLIGGELGLSYAQ